MKKSWTKLLTTAIICNLLVHGVEKLCAEEGFLGEERALGVAVSVRSEDANRHRTEQELRLKLAEVESQLSLLSAESRKLRDSERQSREELIEITKRYQKQNEQYHQLQLVMSGALAGGQVRSAGEREEQLLQTIDDIAKDGGELAIKTVEFCELVSGMMPSLQIGKVKQAELQLKLEGLMRKSRQFVTLTNPERSEMGLAKSHILAVNRELSMVVLPVGSVHGAFNGLIYYVGKSDTVLKVVGVRPFVAAALLVSGNIDDLTPGMEVATEKK